MIILSAELRVKPGKGDVLEQTFAQLAEGVAAHEPGTLVFTLSRSRTDPDLYTAFEVYASAEAIEAHGKSDHVQLARKTFAEIFAGASVMEMRDATCAMARPIALGSL